MELPLPSLPLPPLPMPQPAAKWELNKVGYDRAHLHVNGVLSRHDIFTLIGQLERLGGSL